VLSISIVWSAATSSLAHTLMHVSALKTVTDACLHGVFPDGDF